MPLTEVYVAVPIPEFNAFYLIGNQGSVKSLVTGKILRYSVSHKGYALVCLHVKGKKKTASVHRLVALAFIPNPDNKPTVNHKDGDKLNNVCDNLEWATHTEQSYHARSLGLCSSLKGICRDPLLPPAPGIEVRCVETGEIFASILQCAKSVQYSYTHTRNSIFEKKLIRGRMYELTGVALNQPKKEPK